MPEPTSRVLSGGGTGRPRPSRSLLVVGYALFLMGVAEAGARGYWLMARGAPFFKLDATELRRAFYPELRRLRADVTTRDAVFDVLLLGGSALHPCCGTVEERLRDELQRASPMAVRGHNLAKPAHTTLDSLIKYRELGERRFDLVVVYHGINDVRANNVPPERFRSDYSHYAWYRELAALARHRELPWLVSPYTADFAWTAGLDRLGLAGLVSVKRPRPEWLTFGAEVKTAATFRANLESVLQLARSRGETVALETYATYLAPGYTLERFWAHQLDYGSGTGTPLELWGRPEDVMAAVAVHNGIVRALAASHPEAVFVDQDALVPKSGRFFDDVCHLTDEGGARFAANLVRALVERRLLPVRSPVAP